MVIIGGDKYFQTDGTDWVFVLLKICLPKKKKRTGQSPIALHRRPTRIHRWRIRWLEFQPNNITSGSEPLGFWSIRYLFHQKITAEHLMQLDLMWNGSKWIKCYMHFPVIPNYLVHLSIHLHKILLDDVESVHAGCRESLGLSLN